MLWSRGRNDPNFPPSFCDTYEIHPSPYCTYIRFAGYQGNVIEFRVKYFSFAFDSKTYKLLQQPCLTLQVDKPSNHGMLFSFESAITLTCKQVNVNRHAKLDFPFTLLVYYFVFVIMIFFRMLSFHYPLKAGS